MKRLRDLTQPQGVGTGSGAPMTFSELGSVNLGSASRQFRHPRAHAEASFPFQPCYNMNSGLLAIPTHPLHNRHDEAMKLLYN